MHGSPNPTAHTKQAGLRWCYNNCLTATVKITVYEVFLPDIHQHASVFLPCTANLCHTLSVAKEELDNRAGPGAATVGKAAGG